MNRWSTVALFVLLCGCANGPPKPTTSCVDFNSYKDGQQVKGKVTLDRFTFGSGRESPIEFRAAGGVVGLLIKEHVYVAVDEPFTQYEINYVSNSAQPIRFESYAQDATILESRTLSAEPQNTLLSQPLPTAKPTKLLGFYDGGDAGLLTKICVTH